MAIVGRAIRQAMRDAALETPERAAERVLVRECYAQAHAEMLARFAPLTGENVAAALAWQEARGRELVAARKAGE